jgi:predicted DsbA family dithiol-disulfide isomerase
MATLSIQRFGDPACPWDFSAEPARYRLRWHYGEQIEWRPTMIVLSQSVEEIESKGFSSERMAEGLTWFRGRFGMPIETAEKPLSASIDACRAVVATRLHAPEQTEAILRRLRIRYMGGGKLDDPELIHGAATDVGIDPAELDAWVGEAEVEQALREDMRATRSPSAVARALDHKLGGPDNERRYTAPSYVISRLDDGRTIDVPGFNAVEGYEAAIANLAAELERRPKPESVEELLAWAGEPLATVEVALVCQLDVEEARRQLDQAGVTAIPVAGDAYWTLEPVSAQQAA